MKKHTKTAPLPQRDINSAVAVTLAVYGKEATLQALNIMYHAGVITDDQALALLDVLNK